MKKILFSFLALCMSAVGFSQLSFYGETGVAFSGYNDVRISGSEGTDISFKDDLTTDAKIYHRLRATYDFNERHSLSLLYSPLTLKASGVVDRDILFEGVNFIAGERIDAEYKFNSYRLSYRNDFVQKEKLEFGLGISLKIRDARIGLESNLTESEKTNVGFVPLINFRLKGQFTDKLGYLVYGDALAAPQGRAEDVLASLTYKISEPIEINAGYRILEGGADADEVYNFTLINYGALGIRYKF